MWSEIKKGEQCSPFLHIVQALAQMDHINQSAVNKPPTLVSTATVRIVCNCVHNSKPVSDSKIKLPAMVSDSSTQNALTPTDIWRRVSAPIGVASI